MLISEGDEAGLLKSLKRLVGDKELREELSRNSMITLKKKFTEKHMIDKLEDYFLTMAARRF